MEIDLAPRMPLSSKYVHFQMFQRSRSSLDLAMEMFEEEQSQALGEEPSDEGFDEQGEQDPQSEEEPEEGKERQGAQDPESEEEPEEGKKRQVAKEPEEGKMCPITRYIRKGIIDNLLMEDRIKKEAARRFDFDYAKEPEKGKKRPIAGHHRLMQDCIAKRVARRFDYGQCSSIGCPRMRQYVKGCSWDRCRKFGFVTDCLEHEQWCDDMHMGVKKMLKQQILEDTDDESDLLGSWEDGRSATSSTTVLRDSQ